MSKSQIEQVIKNVGMLVNNNEVVMGLVSVVGSANHAESMMPALIAEVIEGHLWRDRMDMNGRRFSYGPGEFSKFIRDESPKGLETTEDVIRRYLGDPTDPVRVKFEALLSAGPRDGATEPA